MNSLHPKTRGKNDFVEISKSLIGYKSENNFVKLSKLLCRLLKHNKHVTKNVDILVTNFNIHYFDELNKIIFRPVTG